ncbi:hypothetical protein JTE90_012891 [Oedothorax gibbosus]|uniref:UvrD-like helicase C-terminal domain-containing protein n=1 Tax=Oedothorax gibbosus TaxID=931172 RepID=A0AAV6TML3_9ARAC|nr:hypothetical protein JTE90_012891 [Oedothorax gibbosus]
MTIHKSQGSTYDNVVVHLHSGMTTPLLYVAWFPKHKSVRTIPHWKIQEDDPRPVNHPLTMEMLRHSEVTISPEFLHIRIESEHIQVMFHNVQSFHKHWPIYASDSVYTNSDIILMTRDWTVKEESRLSKPTT